ncbi:MAG TPA: hypothetical protein VFQ70_01850, partial [Candidatus Saccharimonadaceae bacterium]|nr:hypothetical protein [Candidatus Saccharimonadaceae bacterium]
MILFPTELSDYYNFIIHTFLTSEYIELRDKQDKYDCLDDFFSEDLLREQPDKCLSVADDLYYWTKDQYPHEMSAFHEFALYNFLHGMSDIQSDEPEFDKWYYDNDEDRRNIKKMWNNRSKGAWTEIAKTERELAEFAHNVDTMLELC